MSAAASSPIRLHGLLKLWIGSVAGEIVRLKFRVRILLTWSWRCGCGDGGEEIGDVVFLFINTIVNVVVGISWDLLCHEMVLAWQSRGVLPMAVEITSELISIQQRDSRMNTDLPPNVAVPAEMLRMMYSMAIVRFVNGVVDQSVRRITPSGTSKAEEVRLPRIFLDIRHETSHNELPSLPLVRRASKQALAWLQKYYWEDQEQLLPDTQDSLKTKLIEHAQVIYEILVTQQRLLSKEPKGQEYNLQRWTLKRALKGMKRQQQSLLRELLELISSGTSELASLLVKQGLLIHDLSLSCSSRMPSNDFLEYRNSSDFEGVLQSRSSCDNLGTAVKHENNSVAAWRHTCVQLAYHMPQLPSLLLSSIIETLATMSHNSSSKMESKENTVAFMSKEDLLEWATWMLDQSSALSKKKKSPSGISDFIETSANVQMHADFPQDSLKELGHLCLRSKIDKACLVELVSRISALVNEGSFRRCAKVLERCSPSCSVGGNFQDVGVDVNMKEVGRNFVGHESVSRSQSKAVGELESETAFIKARELQQMSMAKYVASVKAFECSSPIESLAIAGPWLQAEQWTPCAKRSVPSAHGNEAAIHPIDLKQNASVSFELGHSGRESEFTRETRSVRFKLSTVVSNHCNGQDSKRKTFETQTESSPQVFFKRKRLEDQPMIEETRIVIYDKGNGSDGDEEQLVLTDDTGWMDCDGECSEPMDEDHAFLDDDRSGKVVPCMDESISDCSMEHRPLNISPKTEEVTVTCQGCLLQGGSSLQELPNLQAAIRVL
ncbi:uncharacterized protein [Physcomitrium patens]|uniref:uncharacterized protein isoform X4 n=1 Tax=Physcomitrium patens TaxID=3218 RepID=UPI003CCE4B94